MRHCYHFDLQMCFTSQRRALFPHLNLQKWSETVLIFNAFDFPTACTFSTSQRPKVVRDRQLLTLLSSKCASCPNGVAACTFCTSQLPIVLQEWWVFYILTSKCASRNNAVHFFNISTSKSVPSMVCFARFDLEMCFAPQCRALFRHLI